MVAGRRRSLMYPKPRRRSRGRQRRASLPSTWGGRSLPRRARATDRSASHGTVAGDGGVTAAEEEEGDAQQLDEAVQRWRDHFDVIAEGAALHLAAAMHSNRPLTRDAQRTVAATGTPRASAAAEAAAPAAAPDAPVAHLRGSFVTVAPRLVWHRGVDGTWRLVEPGARAFEPPPPEPPQAPPVSPERRSRRMKRATSKRVNVRARRTRPAQPSSRAHSPRAATRIMDKRVHEVRSARASRPDSPAPRI